MSVVPMRPGIEVAPTPEQVSNDVRDTLMAALYEAEEGTITAVCIVWINADGTADRVWSHQGGENGMALRTALRDADSELRGEDG